VQAAVSETRELLPMSSDRGICENRLGHDSGATLMVPTISLDSSGLPLPDLIKMDVEGAEAAVLRGAQRTLREARPVLFVALHRDEQRKTCAIILRDAGYSIHDLDGQRLGGTPSVDEIYALPVEAHTT
jgi:methyltransferase FkbM-like protein